jgi:hypothetical protein
MLTFLALFLALFSVPGFLLLWSIMKVSGQISQSENNQ